MTFLDTLPQNRLRPVNPLDPTTTKSTLLAPAISTIRCTG